MYWRVGKSYSKIASKKLRSKQLLESIIQTITYTETKSPSLLASLQKNRAWSSVAEHSTSTCDALGLMSGIINIQNETQNIKMLNKSYYKYVYENKY